MRKLNLFFIENLLNGSQVLDCFVFVFSRTLLNQPTLSGSFVIGVLSIYFSMIVPLYCYGLVMVKNLTYISMCYFLC